MKHHAATVMGIISVHVPPLKCAILRIVQCAPVVQAVKQTIQLFRKRYTEDMTAMQQMTHVADLSMCIKHIINPV
jgi:hypothetical protein